MTPIRLNGNHQAVNIAVASRLRTASVSSLWSSSSVPSSQSSVSSRPVESFGQTCGTRMRSMSVEHAAIERDVLGLAAVVELLAHPRADLLDDLAGVDRGIEAAADREQDFELLQVGLDRRLHVGILQLAGELRCRRAPWRDAPGRARRPPRADARSS